MLSIDLPNSNFDRELEQIQTVQLIAFQSDLWANSKQLEGSNLELLNIHVLIKVS